MAITTTNGKLAIMELDQDYEPGLPLSPGSFGQDDKQQLLWGFPEVLWASSVSGGQIYCRQAFSGLLVELDSFSGKVLELNALNENCGGCG